MSADQNTEKTTSVDSSDTSDDEAETTYRSRDGSTVHTVPNILVKKGYRLGGKLGSGAFSTVFRATNEKRLPGQTFACKRFDLTDANQKVWRDKCLKSEMKIISRLKHPNIVRAFEVIKTRKVAYIFMALAQNGSVGEYLEKTRQPIEEHQAKKWFHDILKGLDFVHKCFMAHRDIKPDNFLLNNDYKTALLSDFGFSCMSVDKEILMKSTNCGTDLYKSPELLNLEEGDVYDPTKSDMYAMGISLFEMLNFNKPFSESLDDQDSKGLASYVRKQKSKEFHFNKNVKLSKMAIKCVEMQLDPDPLKRVTAANLLQHQWFR